MVAQLAPDIEGRRPGCTDACRLIHVIRPGLLGRQPLLVHDAESHEDYGRRQAGARGARSIVQTGRLTIDFGSLGASVDETPLSFGPVEWRLLVYLAEHIGRFRTYRQIVTEIWGPEYLEGGSRNLLGAQLGRLRAKLGRRAAGLIETRAKIGLRLREWPLGEDAPIVPLGTPRSSP